MREWEQVRETWKADAVEPISDFIHAADRVVVRVIWRTAGHYDAHQRLRDLDHDGTAAEVIFHGSQNGEPIPFIVSDPSIGVATMSRVYDVDYGTGALSPVAPDFASFVRQLRPDE